MRDEIFVSDPAYDVLTVERLRELRQQGTKLERARAIGAFARRSVGVPELEAELIATVQEPANQQMRMMGTISLAHIGVACLCIAGSEHEATVIRQLLETWPEPDRSDLRWFLRSQQVKL